VKNSLVITLALATFLVGCLFAFPGCNDAAGTLTNIANLVNPDCLASDALSEAEYDDLSTVEKLLYTKNSCGLYVKRDFENTLDQWF